jgi:type IV secretion system protein VirD4
MKKSHHIFMFPLSCLMFYAGNRCGALYRQLPGDMLAKINGVFRNILPDVSKNIFFLSTEKGSIIAGLVFVISLWLIYLYNVFAKKNYLYGKEHGSAEWGTNSTISKFIDKENPDKNILFTQTESMTIDTRKTLRNNNVMVVGGSGSGKTRFYVKPNIMQMHSSYVITDPKGELLRSSGKMLVDNGYKVKIFNLIKMTESDKYNPFNYIVSEKDILKLINNLITNTTSSQARKGDDFWEKAETALLQALFSYVQSEGRPEERNIKTVMELIRLAEVREEDESFESALDILFQDLKQKQPNHFACKQYDIFKLAAGKTAKSILVSLGVRLSPFYIEELAELMSEDTLELDMVGSEKTALFIILPDSDKTFNFLAAIMYQQLFDILFHKADTEYAGRLPYHVRFMLDEFPNIGQIPQFETYVATMRSREMSANIILQNISQLKSLYEKTWETITGNCDTMLFLGGTEQSTLEYLSKKIGKTTIDHRSINESRGQTGSYSMNYQIVARDLIAPDEIGLLDTDECLLSIRGERPFRSRKYDITKHKKYYAMADGDEGQAFTYEDVQATQNRNEVQSFFRDVGYVMDFGLLEGVNAV